MSRTSSVRRIRYALLACLCAVLAGCSVLAADQTIRPGLGVGRAEPDRNLQVAPPGPRDGAAPAEVVSGFLPAVAGSGGGGVGVPHRGGRRGVDARDTDGRLPRQRSDRRADG